MAGLVRTAKRQREGLHGVLDHSDLQANYPLADGAGTLGRLLLGNGDGAVLTAAPTNFSDTTNSPFVIGDIGKFINIPAGTNQGTYQIIAFVDADNVTLLSATFTDESSIDYEKRDFYSGEDEHNYSRRALREIKGASAFAAAPTALDPTTGNNVNVDIATIAGHTTNFLTSVDDIESEGEAVADTNTEITIADTTNYAKSSDQRGLPMSDGGEFDETKYSNTIAFLVDPETGLPVRDGSENVVFGRMIKGVENTNFKVKFFTGTNDGSATPFTWTAAEPTSINVMYGLRTTLTGRDEAASRKRRVLGLNEDAEVALDIDNLQDFTGGADGESDPTWANEGTGYVLASSPNDLEAALNLVNNEIGDRQYSAIANAIIDDGETITASLEKLAEALDGSSVDKIVEVITATIAAGVPHTLPSSKTYTIDAGGNGFNMDIITNGDFLVADTLSELGDYEEASVTTVTFHEKIVASANNPKSITYLIRKS